MWPRNSEGPVIQTMEVNLQIQNPQTMRMDCILFCLLIFIKNFPREMNNWVQSKRKGGVIILPTILVRRIPNFKKSVLSSSKKGKEPFLFYSFY